MGFCLSVINVYSPVWVLALNNETVIFHLSGCIVDCCLFKNYLRQLCMFNKFKGMLKFHVAQLHGNLLQQLLCCLMTNNYSHHFQGLPLSLLPFSIMNIPPMGMHIHSGQYPAVTFARHSIPLIYINKSNSCFIGVYKIKPYFFLMVIYFVFF